MADYACPYCDKSVTRQALLLTTLNKLISTYHREAGHFGDLKECPLDPCFAVKKIADDKVPYNLVEELRHISQPLNRGKKAVSE